MKYIEKKLPKDFTYMLTKKEIAEINNDLGKCIVTINQEGTSYSETKMARNRTTRLCAVRIKTEVLESELLFHIYLDGIRKSNFKDEKAFTQSKSNLTTELIEKIKGEKVDFENNRIKHESIYLWVDKEK